MKCERLLAKQEGVLHVWSWGKPEGGCVHFDDLLRLTFWKKQKQTNKQKLYWLFGRAYGESKISHSEKPHPLV